MILLKRLARNVQREVGRINKALDKAEVIGEQVGAFVHDENAV